MRSVYERQCTHERPCMALLLEDDPVICRLVSDYAIRDGGFRTMRVERLEDALGYLKTFICDVILLDLGLPDSDGIDSLIRVMEAVSDKIPVVVWTGGLTPALKHELLRNGAQGVLAKPVSGDAVLEMLRSAIERHRIRRRLVEENERLQRILDVACPGCTQTGSLEELKDLLRHMQDFVLREPIAGGASGK